MSQGYNGWTNYETWAVNLWMTNDAGSSEYWNERAETAYREAEGETRDDRKDDAVVNFRDELRDHFDEGGSELLKAGNAETSVFADLLNAALSEVNWDEIAASLVGEQDLDEIDAETADESDD